MNSIKSKSVFQFCANHRTCPKLAEVRDVYTIASQIKNKQHRNAVFVMNNLDQYAVERYLPIVEHLEECWTKPFEGSRSYMSYLIEHLEACWDLI
jgi:hypothetical protein